MFSCRSLAAAAATCVLGLSRSSAAQDVAAAEALFNRGLERMEAGDYEKGCPAIGESYRLDPRPGVLFTLAECEAKRGRIATAYARYGDYLAMFEALPPDKKARQQQQGRDKFAREQRAALGPQVPELKLILAPGMPRGVVVKRDDVVLAEPSLGVSLPLDPGEHVITVELPGRPAIERRVRVAPWEKKEVVLDDQAPAPVVEPPPVPVVVPPPPAAASKPSPATLPPAVPPPPEPREGPGPQRIAAYIIGSIGVVGLGVGAVFGGLTIAKRGSAACGVGDVKDACTHEGKLAIDSASTLGNVSTAGFVAGGVLAAAGVILLVTDRRSSGRTHKAATAPWMSIGVLAADPTGALAGVRGGF
jgi:hypothetical protein